MASNARTTIARGVEDAAPTTGDEPRQGLVAAGGILSAVLASSCCVLPLALTLAGVSGAWMASLRALAPYQPIFVALTAAMLGYGFYLVYWRPRLACVEGSACARPPVPGWFVKTTLWSATLLSATTLSFAYWFPLVVPYLP